MKRVLRILIGLTAVAVLVTSCRTKADLRREQELERIRAEVQSARGDKADQEVFTEETKSELARLAGLVEENREYSRSQFEEIKKEITALSARVQAVEQRAVSEELALRQAPQDRPKSTYENGKRLFDEGKYDDSIEILKAVVKNKGKSEDGKKSQFLLAEAHFNSKDYASAALEFSEFKKNFPKDEKAATATFRQAQSFRNMNKNKEAKLFYQELVDRFPKSSLVAKAKAELKKLK